MRDRVERLLEVHEAHYVLSADAGLLVEIVMVSTVTRAKLCHHAKFRDDWSNAGRDAAIFRFFKMAAAAILDF